MYHLERLIHHQLFRQGYKGFCTGIFHSVMAIVLISGFITSCGGPPPNLVSNTPQNVLIFIGGMNTSIDSQCHEGTFDQLITTYLMKEIGVANPYQNGCNAQSKLLRIPRVPLLFSVISRGKWMSSTVSGFLTSTMPVT